MKAFSCVVLLVGALAVRAQNDIITIDGGEVAAGESVTVNVYFQDVAGTNIDTGSVGLGAFAISFAVPDGVFSNIEAARAGVLSNTSILFEQSQYDVATNNFVWNVTIAFDPPALTLDPPSPGDLIGTLTFTVDPGAGAQTVGLQVDNQVTFIQDELAAVTVRPGNGLLVNTSGIAIGGGGNGGGDPPVINTFSANPQNISLGESSQLNWSVADADSVTIDQGVGAVAASGSVSVSPTQDTSYTLTATNAFGQRSQVISIQVSQPDAVVIRSFDAEFSQIAEGGSTLLRWTVDNATSVEIDQGVGAVDVQSGQVLVIPRQTTTYTLTASNGAGEQTATATVEVTPSVSIDTFTVTPESIGVGETATLNWSVSNADTISLDETVNGETTTISGLGATGQRMTQPQFNATFRLRVANAVSEQETSIELTVTGVDELTTDVTELVFDQVLATNIQVANVLDRPLSWSLVEAPAWLNVSPTSGEVDVTGQTLALSLDADSLAPGVNNGHLILEDANGATVSVAVTAGDTLRVFPLIRADEQYASSLGLINFEDTALAYELTYFSADGAQVGDAITGELAPLATLISDAPELSEGIGWAQMRVPGRPGMRIDGYVNTATQDGEELYAYPPVAPSQTPILVPHIAANPIFYTEGALVNLGRGDDQYAFQAGGVTFDIDRLLDDEQSTFDFRDGLMGGEIIGGGWGSLTGSGGEGRFAAVEIFGRVFDLTSARQSVGVGLDAELRRRLVFPHIAADINNFWTGVVLLNPGDEPANLTYAVFDGAGAPIIPPNAPATLPAGQKTTFLMDLNVQQLGVGAAWLTVDSDTPITGYMLFGSASTGDFFSGFQSAKQTSARLCFPYLDQSLTEGGFTGVAMVNPGDETADITLQLVSEEGTVKQSAPLTLAAKQKYVALVRDLFAENLAGGDKILVLSSTNLAGFQIYGVGRATLGGILAISY